MNSELTSTSESETGPFAAAFQVLDDAIAARAFPGCAFGVLSGSQVLIQGSRGRFTYEQSSPAVTPETVYDLASVTKVVATTAMAMLLYQRGQLGLDALLGSILPQFVAGRPQTDYAQRITLRNLLAHNSGLPGYVEFFRTFASAPELLQACLQLPIETEPGIRAEYSDPGFILLGKALEIIADEGLDRWIRREVFVPLRMSSSYFSPAPATRCAIPPTEDDTTFRHRVIQGEVQDENAAILNGVAGHAGLFSNVPDLLQFAGAILNSQPAIAQTSTLNNPFHSQTVEHFAERQEPKGSSRALGWDTPSERSSSGHRFSRHSIGHLGYSGCSLWIDLDAAIAVVLLTNRTWPGRKCQLIKQIRPAFHDAVRRAI